MIVLRQKVNKLTGFGGWSSFVLGAGSLQLGSLIMQRCRCVRDKVAVEGTWLKRCRNVLFLIQQSVPLHFNPRSPPSHPRPPAQSKQLPLRSQNLHFVLLNQPRWTS